MTVRCSVRSFDAGFGAFAFEQSRRCRWAESVAEELAEGFLVVGDAVLFDERDEVGGGVAGEGGLGEVRVGGEEVFGAGADVGEVAAAAAGDEDLVAGLVGVVEEEDAAAAAAGFEGGHQAGGAGAEDDDVEVCVGVCAPVVILLVCGEDWV